MDSVAKTLGLQGKNAQEYTRLAYFFLQNGELEGAEGAAELAVALDKDDADAWVAIATARAKQKRYQDAVPAYLEALRRRPTDLASWTDLGEAYVYLMDFEHAAAALERALELDPQGQDPWGRRARAIVARVLKQLRK
ncbi:MAG: tetratricopeptide repeat protein [Deltaproteobacteria bacterium]|nr:tetratricopeptide repeat protein [Deltaproteobacteria bacterium]